MTRPSIIVSIALLTLAALNTAQTFAEEKAPPKQPLLGIKGELVDISKHLPGGDEGVASLGMRVDSVKRGTPAWKMGLEKGDIIVSIDLWRFTTVKGYRQALRAAGQKPSIILIDARTKKLVRRPCNLPHTEPSDADQQAIKGESYQMGITLESDREPDGP